jgi:predicted dehydrogenase
MLGDIGMTRRAFLRKSAVAGTGLAFGLQATAFPAGRAGSGPNDKIGVGFVGVGNRGSELLERFMRNSDAEVVALCDVYEPYLLRDRSKIDKRFFSTGKVPRMGEPLSEKVGRYKDFRRLLDRKDVDAVCISTPDHWHAVQTIMAMQAGKDVYVEKPLTITIHEGRRMVAEAARTGRKVQVGLNRRGSSIYRQLVGLVRGGSIGKVLTAEAYRISNMYPNGIGNMQPEDPPEGFDWDMWLGPRANRSYQYNIAPYYFRWWKLYSSQMGNWGVHYMDAIRWMMGEEAPVAVSAHGGKYVLTDDRTIPDTMEVIFEFASGRIVRFSIYEASGGAGVEGGEIELRGTKGNLVVSSRGYKVKPSRAGQFQKWDRLMEPKEKQIKEDPTGNLVRNFLDCVSSRKQPRCTLEDGHRSTTFAHLANIALEMKTRIEWDPVKERITNNNEANELLHYEYRKPWKLG